MSLYEGAVKRPIMTSLVFVAIAVFGLYSLSKLPIDLLPDIETNQIMIFTSYSGASAEDIENNVTRPLENTLNTVNHLKHITSKSSENLSLITLEFEYGYDIDDLTNDVRDKLDMVSSSLPDDANTPIIFKFSTDMIPILMLSVQANESEAGLYKILDDGIVNPLARVPGVGTVSISGAPERTVYIYCDPNQLEAYNLTVEAISNVVKAENRNIPGGNFDIGSETYSLRVKGEFSDPKQMENIVVASVDGRNVYLRDVARVVDTTQERAQETYNNGVKGAMINVQKQSGANSVDIAEKVMNMLPQLQKNLPSDIKIGVIANTSDNIVKTVGTLTETVLLAFVFVVLVVFVFLGRWRATVIICLTIPLSLVASFIYLAITDSSLNIISLSCLSIAIGMVVDDSIVVLENITTHIERGSDPKQAAIHATNEVALSVVASTLTIVAVFFPLTMVSGMTGVLFKELGWMMCVIIVISMVTALSLTPMMCSRMLRLQKKQTKTFTVIYGPIQKALDKLDYYYSRLINWAVRHRKTVIFSCFGFFALSLITVKFIGSEFFPSQDSGRLSATIEMPIGTRVEKARALAEELTEKWKARYGNDIPTINYTVGKASDDNTFASMQSNGTNIIRFNIKLVDMDQRKIGLAQVCDEMRADLRQIPDVAKFQVLLGGDKSPMGGQSTANFEIYGYDFTTTDSLAKLFREKMLEVKGVGEVNISRSDYQPEVQVDFDREKLAMHGLNLTTAATYLRDRVNGALSSYYREDGDEYDIYVRYAPEFRTSVEDLENILLYGTGQNAVRVKDVGNVVERFSPPTIERKDRQRINTVSCVVSGVPMSDVVKAGNEIIDKMDIPAGVSIAISGSYEDQQDSFKDLSTLGVLILILVFIVMAAQFESLTTPFIIMFSIPFALSGVLIALWTSGTTLNVMSLLGAIMLIGIVVKNGIVLIDYTRLCRERGQSIIQACVTAGKSRLRPVLMTTLTTILGMIPMAISHGQGSEMWRPMGIAVIGGLTISTILTLILVPSVYAAFSGIAIKNKHRSLRKKIEIHKYWEANKDKALKHKK